MIYVGQHKVSDIPIPENVERQSLLGTGYPVYSDNSYSSPNLYLHLLKQYKCNRNCTKKQEKHAKETFII